MQHFSLSELRSRHAGSADMYDEFLRIDSMSAGLYVIPTAGADPQSPHDEDEVYVVLAGSASFTTAEQTIPVSFGSTIFVPAREPHRFHDVTEELEVVVLFAPAESTAPASVLPAS
jgi:mannose-6-phosphate isomerase-like protein (cupin superfamily)